MLKPARIFISYASEDRATAGELYRRLKRAGHYVFMDKPSIGWGRQWEPEIRRELQKTDRFIPLVSPHSVRPDRYFHKEVDAVLVLFQGKPHKTILPIKIQHCDLPENLSHIQAIEFFKPYRWPRLLRLLKSAIPKPASSMADSNMEIPTSLTTRPFVFPKPRWLRESERKKLSELAKAAFLLLLFEQTEKTGCWGKSYLPRHLAPGESLPEALGAITGTPFALMAISSYAKRTKADSGTLGRCERLIFESTDYAVFETLDGLLQPDGRYRRGYKEVSIGRQIVPEHSRHEAGACLIRVLYKRDISERDLSTIVRLCRAVNNDANLFTYDYAVISRLFFQLRYANFMPPGLQTKVALSRKKVLTKLIRDIENAPPSDIALPANDSRTSGIDDATNQWSTAWYVLPLLTLRDVPSNSRAQLVERVRVFFSDRSRAALEDSSLLPTEIRESNTGIGKSTFGTGMALLACRILEQSSLRHLSSSQAEKMVNRLVQSPADAITEPMLNPKPLKPEGYLGWGAICLAAASVGIHLSQLDCAAAIALTKELNQQKLNRSEKDLKVSYQRAIKKSKLVAPKMAQHVASAAAKLALFYEPVKKLLSRSRRTKKVPI